MATPTLSRRRLLGLGGASAATAVAAVAGCSTKTASGPGAKAASGPITFWSGYSVTDPNNKNKKPADFWISKSIQRFTTNTGIQVKVDALPSDATMFTKIRTASIGGNGPDVANVWSGSYMLGVGSFLEPMRQYFNDAEYAALAGWPAVTKGFDPSQKDQILGVPNGSDGAMALVFNKQALSAAKVDPSSWPTDFETFLTDLAKIKATGMTPLALGKSSYLFYAYDTWLAQAAGGPTGIGALNSGSRQFSAPEFVDVTNKWLQLRPYTNEGAASTDDSLAYQQLFTGKAAMAVAGAAIVPQLRQEFKDNSAIAKLPNISPSGVSGGTVGGCGNAFIVSKASKHKPAAVALIKHLLSAPEQKLFAESGESGPLVGRTDMKNVYTDPLINEAAGWGIAANNTFWPDNTFSADLVNELGVQAQLAWDGSISASAFLSRLDKKRDALK